MLSSVDITPMFFHRQAFAFIRKGFFFRLLLFGITVPGYTASWQSGGTCQCPVDEWGGPYFCTIVANRSTQQECISALTTICIAGTQGCGFYTPPCVLTTVPNCSCYGTDCPTGGGGGGGTFSETFFQNNLGGSGITSEAGGLLNDLGATRVTGPEQGQPTFTSHATTANKQWMEEVLRRGSAIASLRDTPVPQTTVDYDRNYLKKAGAGACAGQPGPCIGSLSAVPKVIGGSLYDQNRNIPIPNVPVPKPDHNAGKDGGISGKAKGLMTFSILPNLMDPAGSVNIAMSKIGEFAKRQGWKPLSDATKGGTTAPIVSATGDGKVTLSIGAKFGEDGKVGLTVGLQSKGDKITATAGSTTQIGGDKFSAKVGESVDGDGKKKETTSVGISPVLGVGAEVTTSDDGGKGAKVSAFGSGAEMTIKDGHVSGKVTVAVTPGLTVSLEKGKDGQVSAGGELGQKAEVAGIGVEAKVGAKFDAQSTDANKGMVQASVGLADKATGAANAIAQTDAVKTMVKAADAMSAKADLWLGWGQKEAPKIQQSPFEQEPK